MGPRNPVARGFSLLRFGDLAGKNPSRASAVRGPSSRSTSIDADAFVSRPEDAAAGLEVLQARRPEGRETAGGRWFRLVAGYRLLAIPSVARLQTEVSRVPFGGLLVSTPSGAGQGPARVFGVDRRTSTEWADAPRARIAGTDPRGTGGWQRVGRSPTRPVLKHGPRSLTCARVNGS